MELRDVIPTTGEFTLRKTGKTYRLRPFNLEDEAWLQETFKPEELHRILEEGIATEIAKIAFHQMEIEDQRSFRLQDVTVVDGDGVEHVRTLGGYALFFRFISGLDEKVAIYTALLRTIGVSRPLVEDLEREVGISGEKKRTQNTKPTGRKSLTHSSVSTAGRKRKSRG
jgi:hypothetical protein